MNILEKEIEDLVYEAAKNCPAALIERGLEISTLGMNPAVFRQVQIGAYGITDVVLVGYNPYDKEYQIEILELKKDGVDYNTLDQAIRYKRGIVKLIETRYPKVKYEITISLIGRSINFDTSFCYLPDMLPGVNIYLYSLDFMKGLQFTSIEGYYLKSQNLSIAPSDSLSEVKSHVYSQIRKCYGKEIH